MRFQVLFKRKHHAGRMCSHGKFSCFFDEVKHIYSPRLDREPYVTITLIVDLEKTAPYVCLQR